MRPFSADMSLKTVMRLSANWHEAVATNMVGPNYEFPEPWCDGGHSGGYEIIPIAINQSISSCSFLLTGNPCANCKTT